MIGKFCLDRGCRWLPLVGDRLAVRNFHEIRFKKNISYKSYRYQNRRKMVYPLASFASAFASAVIVQTNKDSWVARKGQFCVFNVLRQVSPQV